MSKLSLSVERAAPREELALPDPGKVGRAVLVNACRAIYEGRDDLIGGMGLPAADELRRRGAAIEEYLRGTEAFPDAQRAARVLEMAVGAALGPTSKTNGRLLPAGKSSIEATQRHEFRALHAGRAKIEPFLESDGLSREAALRIAKGGDAGLHDRAGAMFTSDTGEWYTPAKVIAATVEAMGGIDLDPCAEPARGVPAERHFTEAEDGLSQPWRGRVYMNPPYGKTIGEWVDKLAEEYEYGNVTQAVALLPARTDTSWWAHLPAATVCFFTGRLTFSEHPSPAPFPSAACYLGPNQRDFAAAFIGLGLVYVRLETDAAA